MKKEFIKIREYLCDFLTDEISHITTISDEDKFAVYNIMLDFFYEKIHNRPASRESDTMTQLFYGKEVYEKIFPDRKYSATIGRK